LSYIRIIDHVLDNATCLALVSAQFDRNGQFNVLAQSLRDPNGLYQRARFRFDEWRSGYATEKRIFEEHHGYPLDLDNPRSFSQKICWRKLFDRNPLLQRVVDKFAVRSYVAEVLGQERADQVLIPLLAQVTDPSDIPFDRLHGNYILKANHGSGMNRLVRDDQAPDIPGIMSQCREWLSQSYGTYKHEWAYEAMRRRVVIEALIDDGRGLPVRELKFQMFGGKCALIQVLNDASWYDGYKYLGSGLPTLTYFTPEWQPLDISWYYYWLDVNFPSDKSQKPPSNLDEMLRLAEQLSEPFDYIRVDLYEVDGGVRFGELTPYHLSGQAKITPREFDFELGERWELPTRWRSRSRGNGS
jgi:hypothetical protein